MITGLCGSAHSLADVTESPPPPGAGSFVPLGQAPKLWPRQLVLSELGSAAGVFGSALFCFPAQCETRLYPASTPIFIRSNVR